MKIDARVLFSMTLAFNLSTALGAPSAKKGLVAIAPPQVVARVQAKRLFIVGFAGSLTLIPNMKNDDVIIRAQKSGDGEDPAVNLEFLNQYTIQANNLGDTVEVRAQPPGQAADWSRWTQGKHLPEVRLEVTAPPTMNVEAFWTHGDVHISQWKAPVFLTSQEGKVILDNGAFDVTARTVYGFLKIENIKGTVSVENFASQVNVSDVTGRTRLRTFSGESHLKNITGNVVVSSQKAAVTTQDTTGALEVQSGLAAIHVVEHKGPLYGHSDGGAISARIKGPVDVRLVSQTGPLSLTVGRESQASVSLSTKGMLNAPRELEKKSSPDAKVIQGDLQGSQPGHLRMASDSGDLTLRVL